MSDPTGRSPRLKGRSFVETRSAVLDLIRSEGEISRTDLARRSALTEKTISVVVKSLMESGVVIESGFAQSTGGKRPILLRLNDQQLYAVGISIHPARCVLVVCGLDGTELARGEIRGGGTDEPVAVLKRISAALNRLLKRLGIAKDSVIGVCIAMGGRRASADRWQSETSFADAWEPYPAEVELAKATGLAVMRENDANCAALGEFWTTGNASQDFVTLYMAHGIGCGIIINGSIYRGASGNAGEIGHVQADPNGRPCWCGRRGCLETVASPRAIIDQIVRSPELARACGVTPETDFADIYRRFGERVKGGVPEALEVFETAAGHLAAAVVDLVTTLDLDRVTLAGPGFAELGEEYRRTIDQRLTESAFVRDVHPTTVRLAAGGVDASALGAASVVLHRYLTPHHSAP
jgi:predicted NBD/HSP70 family sugar kinase